MIWPGMGDPAKRKKTLKYLIITAVIGIGVAAANTTIQAALKADNPLYSCIDDKQTNYKIAATLELYVDKHKIDIPANIGNIDGCRHTIYTLTNDGVIHAEWTEEYPFEIGHFLWVWTTYHKDGFPKRDMDDSKSKIFVNGKESEHYTRAPLIDGAHYRAEFFTKAYDQNQDRDFAPPK